jgi:hypothetical protein
VSLRPKSRSSARYPRPKIPPTTAMVTRKPGRGATIPTRKAAAAARRPAARGFSQAQL